MPFLSWSAELGLGIPSIDDQHQALADLVNRIHADLHARVPQPALQADFARLAEATAAHFRHEEDLIAATDYPQASAHARKHAALLWMLGKFERDLDRNGSPAYLADRLDFLRKWLIDHIAEEDAPLARHLRSQAA